MSKQYATAYFDSYYLYNYLSYTTLYVKINLCLSSGVPVRLITQSMIASEEVPHFLCYMKMATTSSALSQRYLNERGWGGG